MDAMHPKPVSPTRLRIASAAADTLSLALSSSRIAEEFFHLSGAQNLVTSLMLPAFEPVTLKLMHCTRMMCMHCEQSKVDACAAVRVHGGLLTLCMLMNEAASNVKEETERVVMAATRTLAAVVEGCPENCEFATAGIYPNYSCLCCSQCHTMLCEFHLSRTLSRKTLGHHHSETCHQRVTIKSKSMQPYYES